MGQGYEKAFADLKCEIKSECGIFRVRKYNHVFLLDAIA
jgi:hypothetical protein